MFQAVFRLYGDLHRSVSTFHRDLQVKIGPKTPFTTSLGNPVLFTVLSRPHGGSQLFARHHSLVLVYG